MLDLAPHLRGSRNVIRLSVLAVGIALIAWLQMVELPNPDMDDDAAAATRAAAPAESTRRAVATREKVNPGIFRPEIVPLEQALYKLAPKFDDGWAVEIRAKALADALFQYRDDPAKSRAGIAVSRFGVMVGARMDAPYNRGPDWQEWRKQWQRVRGEFFKHADWYEMHDPMGMPLSSLGRPVSPADRATVQALTDLAVELQAGIRRGLDQAMQIPEPPNDVVRQTDEGRRIEKRWRDWVNQWGQHVDSIARRHHTTLSPTADPHVVLAGRQLDSVFTDLRLSTLAAGRLAYPSKQARRQRLDSALIRVQKARDHLARIGTSAQ